MTAFIIFFCIITPTNIYNSILKSTKMKKYRNLNLSIFLPSKTKKRLIVNKIYPLKSIKPYSPLLSTESNCIFSYRIGIKIIFFIYPWLKDYFFIFYIKYSL